MNNLILQHNNLFSKFLIWLRKKFFKTEKYSKSKDGQNITNINNDIQKLQKQKRRYVYVQDLDYETEKKNTIDLYQKIMNGEMKVEDLELADMIRIKLLLDIDILCK